MTLGPARYPYHSVDVQVLSWAVGKGLLLSHVQNHREMKVQGQAASAGCCRENSSGDRRGTPVVGLLEVHKEAGPKIL